jgi:hypothetical protein
MPMVILIRRLTNIFPLTKNNHDDYHERDQTYVHPALEHIWGFHIVTDNEKTRFMLRIVDEVDDVGLGDFISGKSDS